MYELSESRKRIAGLHNLQAERVFALSFPHGEYSREIVSAAKTAGYRLLFTSDPCLNSLRPTDRQRYIFARLVVSEEMISTPDGKFRPELLALWLFTRSICFGGSK